MERCQGGAREGDGEVRASTKPELCNLSISSRLASFALLSRKVARTGSCCAGETSMTERGPFARRMGKRGTEKQRY